MDLSGLSGYTFTFILVLRISLLQKHLYFWNPGYIWDRIEVFRNSRNSCFFCLFFVKFTFFTKKFENLFFRLKCFSLISNLYTENQFQIRITVNEIHALKIFLYGICMGVILNKLWLVYISVNSVGPKFSMSSGCVFCELLILIMC